MKNLTKLFCLLFVGQLCIGQPTSLSELRPKYTVPIKKEIKEEPLVYSVNEVSFEKTITADIVPILNKDYDLLERNIKTLEKDSVYYHNKLEVATKRLNDLFKIRTLISEFIISPEDFESKKEKLISAQMLSDQYNLKELIFANETINSENLTDFFVLQIDDEYLNKHLKKVIWNIEGLFTALPVTNPSFVNKNLQKLRIAIKGLNKYKYSTGTYKNLIRDGMVVSNDFDSSEFSKGDFEQLGRYYILYNGYKGRFQEGELVNQNTAIKNNLIDNSYSGGSWELIKQKKTDKLYIIDLNFVDEYAFFKNGELDRDKLPAGIFRESNIVLSDN